MSLASDEFTHRTNTMSVSPRPSIKFPTNEITSLAAFCAELYRKGIDFQVERYNDETFIVFFTGLRQWE